jgi:chaperone BCS1
MLDFATMFRRYCMVTMEVTSKDRSYPWVLQWLYARGNMNQHLSVETTLRATNSGNSSVKVDFVPGPGRHVLKYKNQYMLVQRIREQQMVDLNSGKPWEKIQFTSYGRSTKFFEEILAESFDMCMKQEEGKTIIYTNWGAEWRQFGQPRRKRAINSVILDEGVSEKLIDDINEWSSSAAWYSDRYILIF